MPICAVLTMPQVPQEILPGSFLASVLEAKLAPEISTNDVTPHQGDRIANPSARSQSKLVETRGLIEWAREENLTRKGKVARVRWRTW